MRAEITTPAPRVPLRWLRRTGLAEQDVVVLSASDNLRLPWAVAIGGALASVIASASLGRFDELGFLLLSPLVPVLGVLAAFASTDPLRELTTVTPYSKLRLGLLRTLATLLVALPVMLGLCAFVPVLHELAWVWLLPSLGLTTIALILLRRLTSAQTAVIVVAGWSAVISAIYSFGRLDALSTSALQAAFAVLTALAFTAYIACSAGIRGIGATR